MTRPRAFLARVMAVVRARRLDREIDDEIAGHLAEATDDYIRRGRSPADAPGAALRSFGGVMRARETHRRVRSFGWLEDLGCDVRFGARMLVKDPWLTLAAVAALAMGIAANNTVFTMVNAVLLRDLPFEEANRIVAIGTRAGNARRLNAGVSYADFQDWRAATRAFDGLGAMRETTMNVGDERVAPERFIGSYISADPFSLLRQQPRLGRDLVADDDRRGAEPVVMLGHSLWRTRYGSDPGVLGSGSP